VTPDQPLLNMLEAVGSEIGQFIQRKRVEAERENLLMREKALREKAEIASRLKDEFLATVSHELRTPLNAIIGWGQILQTGKLEPQKQADALKTIFRNAKTQAQLINDLLDTSRLMTGNLLLNLSPTPVIPVVEAALDAVRPAAEAKGVRLSCVYNSEVEAITCDAQRLQQIIWNLLTNAVKFTPVNGEVTITLEQNNETIRIIVSDDGEGISSEFLPFVFDRFRQADSSSTRKHNGLGLGLAIVRHLAELHGGTVTAASGGHGKGATFTVTLPLSLVVETPSKNASEKTNGHKQTEKSKTGLRGLRILVVDDDIDTCEMLTYALNLLGAETQASNSVREAFVSMAEWEPDVLLTDINMPEEDGYSLIRQLRTAPSKKADIPVIALTALARPEDGEQALSAGFQLHMAKPVDIEELAEAIVNLAKKP
jgi:signal transduction histidine kinase/ActR/RegA family two-component response regulator